MLVQQCYPGWSCGYANELLQGEERGWERKGEGERRTVRAEEIALEKRSYPRKLSFSY